jgi:hypothetical protein
MIREAECLAPQSPVFGQGIGRPLGTGSRWQALDAGLVRECQQKLRSVNAPYRQPAVGLSFSLFDNPYIGARGLCQWRLIRGSASDGSSPHCSVAFAVRLLRIRVRQVCEPFILSVSSPTVTQRSLKKSRTGEVMDLSMSPEMRSRLLIRNYDNASESSVTKAGARLSLYKGSLTYGSGCGGSRYTPKTVSRSRVTMPCRQPPGALSQKRAQDYVSRLLQSCRW